VAILCQDTKTTFERILETVLTVLSEIEEQERNRNRCFLHFFLQLVGRQLSRQLARR
jgi:hypothetical protein